MHPSHHTPPPCAWARPFIASPPVYKDRAYGAVLHLEGIDPITSPLFISEPPPPQTLTTVPIRFDDDDDDDDGEGRRKDGGGAAQI